MRLAFTSLAGAGMLSLMAVVAGCDREVHDSDWKTLKVREGSAVSSIRIYVLTYGDTAETATVPRVAILWDGREVFDGCLPADYGTMPVWLLEVRSDAGHHVLEVRAGTRTQKQDVDLDNAEEQCYDISGVRHGGELIKGLGHNPMFQ